jgi:hypothetical protein
LRWNRNLVSFFITFEETHAIVDFVFADCTVKSIVLLEILSVLQEIEGIFILDGDELLFSIVNDVTDLLR